MTRVWGTVYVLASLGCASNAPSALPTSETWVQVWSDEFDGAAGASIDTTKWRYDTADGCAGGNCGWGNNEKEYYSTAPENISLNGRGQLLIVARPVPAGAGLRCYYGPCRYTSAKITTRGKMEVAPGRVTARIKLAPGQGLWPAFWLLGRNISTVGWPARDRKSTRLNSSHSQISYAVFCLKKKKKKKSSILLDKQTKSKQE